MKKKLILILIIFLLLFNAAFSNNIQTSVIKYYSNKDLILSNEFTDFVKKKRNEQTTQQSGSIENKDDKFEDQINVSGQFWDSRLLEEQSKEQKRRQEQVQEELDNLKYEGTTQIEVKEEFDNIENALLQNSYYVVAIKLNYNGNLGHLSSYNEHLIFMPYSVGENVEAMQGVLDKLYKANQRGSNEVKELLTEYGIKYWSTNSIIDDITLRIGPKNGVKEKVETTRTLDKNYTPQVLQKYKTEDSVILYTVFSQQDFERETNQIDTSIKSLNQIFVTFDNSVPMLGGVTYKAGWLPDAQVSVQKQNTNAIVEIERLVHYPFYKSYIKLYFLIGLTILFVGLGVVVVYFYKKKKYDRIVEKTSDHDFL